MLLAARHYIQQPLSARFAFAPLRQVLFENWSPKRLPVPVTPPFSPNSTTSAAITTTLPPPRRRSQSGKYPPQFDDDRFLKSSKAAKAKPIELHTLSSNQAIGSRPKSILIEIYGPPFTSTSSHQTEYHPNPRTIMAGTKRKGSPAKKTNTPKKPRQPKAPKTPMPSAEFDAVEQCKPEIVPWFQVSGGDKGATKMIKFGTCMNPNDQAERLDVWMFPAEQRPGSWMIKLFCYDSNGKMVQGTPTNIQYTWNCTSPVYWASDIAKSRYPSLAVKNKAYQDFKLFVWQHATGLPLPTGKITSKPSKGKDPVLGKSGGSSLLSSSLQSSPAGFERTTDLSKDDRPKRDAWEAWEAYDLGQIDAETVGPAVLKGLIKKYKIAYKNVPKPTEATLKAAHQEREELGLSRCTLTDAWKTGMAGVVGLVAQQSFDRFDYRAVVASAAAKPIGIEFAIPPSEPEAMDIDSDDTSTEPPRTIEEATRIVDDWVQRGRPVDEGQIEPLRSARKMVQQAFIKRCGFGG